MDEFFFHSKQAPAACLIPRTLTLSHPGEGIRTGEESERTRIGTGKCFDPVLANGRLGAMEVRSGYNGNDMGAYMELRDDRVSFFVRVLARGKHSVSYRMRAEIPGRFSVLPAKASAMYAPELKGNSDELKVQIED